MRINDIVGNQEYIIELPFAHIWEAGICVKSLVYYYTYTTSNPLLITFMLDLDL